MIAVITLGCKDSKKKQLKILQYDYYRRDKLEKLNALEITYSDSGEIRNVKALSSIDSLSISFAEKVTPDGIYRSKDNSPFALTHPFHKGNEIESLLKPSPIFFNKKIKDQAQKRYSLNGKDSLNVIFFDENIPLYTFTNSYYGKEVGIFLIYYDPIRETYFKLSHYSGNGDEQYLLKVTEEICNDTTFFSRFIKAPKAPPPSK